MINVRCTRCKGPVTDPDERWNSTDKAISDLVERGVTVVGDPRDPEIYCKPCAAERQTIQAV